MVVPKVPDLTQHNNWMDVIREVLDGHSWPHDGLLIPVDHFDTPELLRIVTYLERASYRKPGAYYAMKAVLRERGIENVAR